MAARAPTILDPKGKTKGTTPKAQKITRATPAFSAKGEGGEPTPRDKEKEEEQRGQGEKKPVEQISA